MSLRDVTIVPKKVSWFALFIKDTKTKKKLEQNGFAYKRPTMTMDSLNKGNSQSHIRKIGDKKTAYDKLVNRHSFF